LLRFEQLFLQHVAEVRMRTANKDRQFSIKSVLVQNTCWLSYTMQRCLLGASLWENFTHVYSEIQDDASEALKLPLYNVWPWVAGHTSDRCQSQGVCYQPRHL